MGKRSILFAILVLFGAAASASVHALTPGDADLHVSITPPVAPIAQDPVTFTYTIVNNGPDEAAAAAIDLVEPAGAYAWDPLGGGISCAARGANQDAHCTFGVLEPGETRTVTWLMQLQPGSNTTSIHATSDTRDPRPIDNSADSTVTARLAEGDPQVGLSGPERALDGDTLHYHLFLGAGGGPDPMNGAITATITLPDSLEVPPVFPWASACDQDASTGYFHCTSNQNLNECTYPGNGSHTFTCVLFTIGPSNDSSTPDFDVVARPDAGTTTATVSVVISPPGSVDDTNPANNAASVTTRLFAGSLPPEADLSVTATAPAVAYPGNTFDYTLTVTNHGPDTAAPITVTNSLPTNVSFVSATGATCIGTPLVCTIPSLAFSDQATLTLTVRANTSGDATDTVAVAASPADRFPDNNTATATTTVRPPSADFSVSATAPAPALVNDIVSLTITVTNHGPDTAVRVLNGTLPSGLLYNGTGSIGCGGEFHGNTFSCGTGPLNPGQSTAFQVTFYAAASGSHDVDLALAPGFAGDDNTANDATTVTVTVNDRPSADTYTTLSGADTAHTGDTYTLTINVSNAGPQTATNTFLNASYTAAAFESEVITPAALGCYVSRSPVAEWATLICNLGSIPKDGTQTVTLTMRAIEPGDFDISAHASPDQVDPNHDNDVADLMLHVTDGAPALSLTCPVDQFAFTDPGHATASLLVGAATATGGVAPVTVAATRSDGEPLANPFPLGDTHVTWTATDTDSATVSCLQHISVSDNEPPATSATAPAGWSNAPVVLTLTASDNVAVASIHISATGAGAFAETTTDGDTAGVTVSAPGVTTVSYWAVDTNGNAEAPHAVDVSIDSDAPRITCAVPPAQWSPANVSIACSANDTASGLANPADASFTLATALADGEESADAATGWRTICDAAGNCAQAGPIPGNHIDRKPPTVAIITPADGASYTAGATVVAEYACTDAGSGPAACTGNVLSGAPIDTATAGPHSFTVQATDAAGNASNVTVTYTVASPAPAYTLCHSAVTPGLVISGGFALVTTRLCDSHGRIVNTRSLSLTAVSIDGQPLDSTLLNPDGAFGMLLGYHFYALHVPASLPSGIHQLGVTVSNDPTIHLIPFRSLQLHR